jgi:predicted phage terminase large subunit-like protein
MMPAFEATRFHQLIIENLELLLSGNIRKLAIICPPRHGKTLLGNIMMPAYALGRNPTETVISVSYGSELSETWGRRVRNILSDPDFHKIFPDCVLSPDSAAAYRFTTTAGGEYSAIGRGGPATGKGASLLILDDLIKDASEANSDTVCRGNIEWLQHVAFTRLTPNGRVLAISTRWSEKDAMGWILQQHGWTVIHLPALAESPADPIGRKIGEALWPSRYPIEALERIRADVGSRVFQCLFQGNVSAAQGTIFKRDWFLRYQQRPESFSRIIQSWDTAFKTGATNDYSVCATFGETKNGFYLLALYRDKVEFPELKRQVAQQADFWRPSEIYVEDKASGQSLIQELKLATTYPVIPVKIDRDKETRASAVTGYFEAGRVFFPEGAAWLADLEDELANFPGGLHDDCVDAITQALNRMRDSGSGGELVEYFKGLANGTRKMVASVQERMRQMFVTPGEEKPAAPPASCQWCGSTNVEIIGSEPGRWACGDCKKTSVIQANVGDECPFKDCKIKLQLVPGGGVRCMNHGQLTFPSLERGGPKGISRGEHLKRLGSFAIRGPSGRF